ncbi:CdaR family transcriptional regulator [Alteribacter aurantiacus]|uniref:CdaR family transcriptional regulator n=1 Tax=Alteribacter aurantiacus TaxID=254410 RepID=UPI00040BF7FF|nr:sugar diacid recognition domain-containing protein [Alteribacter aurantiacus]
MKLLSLLAEKVVDDVSQVLNEEIVVMDEKGIIIAATDDTRVGATHEVAKEVLMSGQKRVISTHQAGKFQHVRAGITLPIRFRKRVIGVIGITGPESEVGGYAELIQRMTELIVHQVYTSDVSNANWRGTELFVHDWLQANHVTKELSNRGELLGVDIEIPRYCVLLEAEGSDELDPPYPPNLENGDVLCRWGSSKYLVLLEERGRQKDLIRQAIKNLTDHFRFYDITIRRVGVSKEMSTPGEIQKAYSEATAAVESCDVGSVQFYDELTLSLVLHDLSEETKGHLKEKVVSVLAAEPALTETLEALFENNLSLKQTAHSLHIHINTLHYRLKKVEEQTGCSWKKVEDLLLLYLCTRLVG